MVRRNIAEDWAAHLILANLLVLRPGDREGRQGLDLLLQTVAQFTGLSDEIVKQSSALAARVVVRRIKGARMEVGYPCDIAAKLCYSVLHSGDLAGRITTSVCAYERALYTEGAKCGITRSARCAYLTIEVRHRVRSPVTILLRWW